MNEHLTELRGFLQRDMRRLPLIFAGLFFLFCLIGYAVCTASPQLTEAVVDYFNRMLSDSGLADEAGNISFVGMLMNNWFAMVFTILYGFVPFLFLPVVTAASNALIIGALAAFYRLNQISMAAFFAGIVPHGIGSGAGGVAWVPPLPQYCARHSAQRKGGPHGGPSGEYSAHDAVCDLPPAADRSPH